MDPFQDFSIENIIFENTRRAFYRVREKQSSAGKILEIGKESLTAPGRAERVHYTYDLLKNLKVDQVLRPQHIWKADGLFFLVYEDFDGVPLEIFVNRQRPKLPHLVQIAWKLVTALQAIHEQGVTHKNINPGHILINSAGDLKIINFSCATRQNQQTAVLIDFNNSEYDAGYIAPEQSGRFSRSISRLSDIYSLGAVLYLLCCGRPAFSAAELPKLMRAHWEKRRPDPRLVNRELPAALAKIIQQCLALYPEDRPRSCAALGRALHKAAGSRSHLPPHAGFTPPAASTGEFIVSQRIIFGDKEKNILNLSFARLIDGAMEALVIDGPAKSGKTALARELMEPLFRHNGIFIEVDCRMAETNQPLSTFTALLRGLTRELVVLSANEKSQWRGRLAAALGNDGQILIELYPELELIMGKQPIVPRLTGKKNEERFGRVIRQFLYCFSGRPLVILLDSFHQSDRQSSAIIRDLCMEVAFHHLLLILTMEDNLPPSHPARAAVAEIRAKKLSTAVRTLRLPPCSAENLRAYLADCFQRPPRDLTKLAERIHTLSRGSFFFIKQLLTLISPDQARLPLPEITAFLERFDSLAEILYFQTAAQEENLKTLLQTAACLENNSGAAFLGRAMGLDISSTLALLVQLANTRLIELYDQQVCFSSPQIRALVYDSIPSGQRQSRHLGLAQAALAEYQQSGTEYFGALAARQLLLAGQPPSPQLAAAFLEAVRQTGRRALAEANLAEGLALSRLARSLAESLPDNPQLKMSVYLELAQAGYLNGHFVEEEYLTDLVLKSNLALTNKVDAYVLKMALQGVKGNFKGVLQTFTDAVMKLDPQLLDESQLSDLEAETINLEKALRLDQLQFIPPMQEPRFKQVCRLIAESGYALQYINPQLFKQLALKLVAISLLHGTSLQTPWGYIWVAGFLCRYFDKYEKAVLTATSALELAEIAGDSRINGMTHFFFAALVCRFAAGQDTGDYFLAAWQLLSTGGEPWGAGYAVFLYCAGSVMQGRDLVSCAADFSRYDYVTAGFPQQSMRSSFLNFRKITSKLRGQDEEHFMDADDLAASDDYNLLVGKLCLLFFAEHYEAGLKLAASADQYKNLWEELFFYADFIFFQALCVLALFNGLLDYEKKHYQILLDTIAGRYTVWSQVNPAGFMSRHLILQAELSRVGSRYQDTARLYDEAIEQARRKCCHSLEALANELAFKFYLAQDKDTVAGSYLVNAYNSYIQWGALAKAKLLEVAYAPFLADITSRLRIQHDMQQNTAMDDRIYASLQKYRITNHEYKIIALIGQGHSNQAIADTLFVSLPTVKRHISHIFAKLNVKSRTELIHLVRV